MVADTLCLKRINCATIGKKERKPMEVRGMTTKKEVGFDLLLHKTLLKRNEGKPELPPIRLSLDTSNELRLKL